MATELPAFRQWLQSPLKLSWPVSFPGQQVTRSLLSSDVRADDSYTAAAVMAREPGERCFQDQNPRL